MDCVIRMYSVPCATVLCSRGQDLPTSVGKRSSLAVPPTTPGGAGVFDRLSPSRVDACVSGTIRTVEAGRARGHLHVVGKPNELFAKFKPEPGFHFLPVNSGPKSRILHTVRADVERLSQSHPGGAVGKDHRRARDF